MHTALMVVLLVTSVILILSILLQSSKSDGLSGSIAGGAEQLLERKRAMVMMRYSLELRQLYQLYISLWH